MTRLFAMLILLLISVFTVGANTALAAPQSPVNKSTESETLTLAGGCFWCLEAVFDELRGVRSVESGYSGGRVENPSYEQVSRGTTGHAEAVQIEFDPTQISRDDILRVYFTIHDPTTLNRQGNDVGPQYRSVAFYRTPEQKASIERIIAEVTERKEWPGPVVTEVIPFVKFYKAENYHQEYFALHGEEPYCQLVVGPKVAKFRKRFHDLRKSAL